jgi:hypothetical protein
MTLPEKFGCEIKPMALGDAVRTLSLIPLSSSP